MKWTLGLILCVTLPPAGILWLAYLCIFARGEGNSLTHRHCCSGEHGTQKRDIGQIETGCLTENFAQKLAVELNEISKRARAPKAARS